MRKQFFRVKQLADQTFSRAEKTEVLTDDLQAADKHVDEIRAALMGLNKRFGHPTNQSTAQDHKEKRMKKCPEYILGQTMLDNAGEDGLISFVLSECGRAQITLANEAVDHELKVEQSVAAPFQHILETDIPNILKQKKNLARLTLDMDSAKTRYQQAMRHSANSGATKVDNLKEEWDEAEAKVEQCRDQLAAEMFQLLSKETELAQTIIEYVKLQRAYHENALHSLEGLIPGLESHINDNEMKPVYGYPLEEHLRVTNRKIALPIQLCVSALLSLGMKEEGLFRIAGGAAKLRRIKLSLDACCLTLPIALEYKDPHVIAGALKSYLRELPEPLLTFSLYSEWMTSVKQTQTETRLRALWDVVHKLPSSNLENLKFLIKFLAILTKNQEVNKMTPQNVAIVIAPNLIWSPQEDVNTIVLNMSTANASSLIVEQLITYADWFFPGEVDFYGDLEIGIVNGGTENVQVTPSINRCISNTSLSDHGESLSQGSPKPATRRKNKPAPTPPNVTPDKNDKKSEDKQPSPLPDKPPRPLASIISNRATQKSPKNDSSDELIIQNDDEPNKDPNKTSEESTNIVDPEQNATDENNEKVIADNEKLNLPIGFEAFNTMDDNIDQPNKSSIDVDIKTKPIPAEKRSSTLERRKIPVAAPRNIITSVSNNTDTEKTEGQKKTENNNVGISSNNKPALPERPPVGFVRPTGYIRQSARHSNENLDIDSGSLILERTHVYTVDKQQVSIIRVPGNGNGINESNGNSTTSNLQRSPSVGSRPLSVPVLEPHHLNDQKPDKPPRPTDLAQKPIPSGRAHVRTRSEGNIIDVQTQTETSVVPKSSPRFISRPPRPQPPPPPPPTTRQHKSEHESTNL